MMGRRTHNAYWLAAIVGVAALCALLASIGQAQISRTVEMVVLDVSVTAKRQYVSGLSKENFQVYENDRPMEITFFNSGDAPVTVGLVIDSSQSMRRKRKEVVAAALAFVAASNPADEMFVTHFNDVVASGFPSGERFSNDQVKLREALLAVAPVGRTSLYDALIEAMKYLERGRHERRALLVVSDGGDNDSEQDLEDVIGLAQRSGATIYTIGIYDPKAEDRNPGALRKIARVSGGEFYEPGRLGLISDVCGHIARDIRNRYTVGYVPVAAEGDTGYRKIQVRVDAADHKKLEVRTRPGYYPRQATENAKKQ